MIDQKEKKEKYFIGLVKRRDEIWEEKRKWPWRKLDKPIQDGWIASIILNKEAARRKDADRMLEAINLCKQDHQIRKNGGHLVSQIRESDNFNKVRPLFLTRAWNGQIVYNGPSLNSIKPEVYEKLTEAQQKWFDEIVTQSISRWGGQIHTHVKYICNILLHHLAIKVSKRMLTQIQEIDPKLLSEEAFIKDNLQEYYRLQGYDRDWGSPEDAKVKRRHWKDAITHVIHGDIEDPKQYSKMRNKKR